MDEDHPTVFKSERWAKAGSPQNNGASVDLADPSDGTWVEFPFFGDGVRWIANRGNASGMAMVQVDDEAPVLVDLYGEKTEYQVEAFRIQFPEPGWHVIRVSVTGTANPQSLGTIVRADGFFYTF